MDTSAKYIKFSGDIAPRMVVFSSGLSHDRMTRAVQNEFPTLKPVSAGFLQVVDFGKGPEYQCFGSSYTLGIQADPEDSRLAERLLAEEE